MQKELCDQKHRKEMKCDAWVKIGQLMVDFFKEEFSVCLFFGGSLVISNSAPLILEAILREELISERRMEKVEGKEPSFHWCLLSTSTCQILYHYLQNISLKQNYFKEKNIGVKPKDLVQLHTAN